MTLDNVEHHSRTIRISARTAASLEAYKTLTQKETIEEAIQQLIENSVLGARE